MTVKSLFNIFFLILLFSSKVQYRFSRNHFKFFFNFDFSNYQTKSTIYYRWMTDPNIFYSTYTSRTLTAHLTFLINLSAPFTHDAFRQAGCSVIAVNDPQIFSWKAPHVPVREFRQRRLNWISEMPGSSLEIDRHPERRAKVIRRGLTTMTRACWPGRATVMGKAGLGV